MRHILVGSCIALLASITFSLFLSAAICAGADPETKIISDAASPLLGIFVGAGWASRAATWRTGLWIGLCGVGSWLIFWMYSMGRLNPLLWIEEGLPYLTVSHFFWWGLAVASGVIGGVVGRSAFRAFFWATVLACIFPLSIMVARTVVLDKSTATKAEPCPGFDVERIGPAPDQTVVYFLTFDFTKQKKLHVGLYDCDSDDASPNDDANTNYLGKTLEGLVSKLESQAKAANRQLLCVSNGGFFGASGFAVAHHEMPVVENGMPLYQVDLLRPKEQGWFFAINSLTSVLAGHPRFSMSPSIPFQELVNYETVLGGVRPLRFEGSSVELKPGAGATTLKCSRTSAGWSADGEKFYLLIVYDPQSEAASQVQRRMHWFHEGGWDVRDVQNFWEKKGVSFALLFDGGESTQLAFRQSDDQYHYVLAGYQYTYTIGYLFHRPLTPSMPILPPSVGHHGVLNYLYVSGPASR